MGVVHGPCLTVLGGVLVWIHLTVPGLGVEEYGLPLRCLQFGELWLGGVRFGDQESGMKDKVWCQAQPRIVRSIREDMKVPWAQGFHGLGIHVLGSGLSWNASGLALTASAILVRTLLESRWHATNSGTCSHTKGLALKQTAQ